MPRVAPPVKAEPVALSPDLSTRSALAAIVAASFVPLMVSLGGASERVHDTVMHRKMRYLMQLQIGDVELQKIKPDELLDFASMQRLRRFARYWDLVGNSGNFVETTPLIWSTFGVPPSGASSGRLKSGLQASRTAFLRFGLTFSEFIPAGSEAFSISPQNDE